MALEFLRVFEPDVYSVIRDHRDMFAGHSDLRYREDIAPAKAFHEAWLEKVPANRRSAVKDLLLHVFPKLESILGGTSYGADWAARWRRELRVCSPDIFNVYFQFGVSPNALRRAELDELITVANRPERVVAILTSASAIKRPDGSSKAREYLDRLNDLKDEIMPEAASGLVIALFDVGDVLLLLEDEQGGMTAIPNRWRLMWTINHLLDRIPSEHRPALLMKVANSKAIGLITYITTVIEDYLAKPDKSGDKPLAHVNAETLEELRSIVLARLSNLEQWHLLAIPDLDYVIHHWIRWAGKEVVAVQLSPILNSAVHLPLLLERYLQWETRQGFGDRVARRIPRVNPKHLEPLTDISALEPLVKGMLRRTDLTANQRVAGEQYLKSMERIRQGKDPDSFFTDDD